MKNGYVLSENLKGVKFDALVVGMMDGKIMAKKPYFDTLKKTIDRVNFKGNAGETLFAFNPSSSGVEQLLIVGLGKKQNMDRQVFRIAGASISKALNGRNVKNPAISLLKEIKGNMGANATALIEGLLIGNHRFDKYRTDKETKAKHIDTFIIEAQKKLNNSLKLGEIMAEGTILARDLITEPASVITPTSMEKVARDLAKQYGFKIKILGKEEAEKLGMGAYLAVAKGSNESPKLIHLSYNPKGAKKKIGIIGKGLTFDSGGLSLKPADAMMTMKCDMSGSAAVMGLMKIIGSLKPKIAIEAVAAMTENMPSGHAIRPGDIVKSMNGKTIEILNTDAEGRLTLADALTYIQKFNVESIINLATLTGACMIALGVDYAGIMGNDEVFIKDLLACAKDAGDPCWQLPLPDEYKKYIKSDVADLRNISTVRYGGAITAGLFLKEFVEEKTPWIHMDIAGPAFREEEGSLAPKGEGTGFGVRTLAYYILSKV